MLESLWLKSHVDGTFYGGDSCQLHLEGTLTLWRKKQIKHAYVIMKKGYSSQLFSLTIIFMQFNTFYQGVAELSWADLVVNFLIKYMIFLREKIKSDGEKKLAIIIFEVEYFFRQCMLSNASFSSRESLPWHSVTSNALVVEKKS